MTLKRRFKEALPGAYFADPAAAGEMAAYLHSRGWMAPGWRIASLTRAGEGNMNLVLRVELDDGSTFILKQARPWAEKFPSVAAPAERAEMEAEYYRRTAAVPALAARSPRLLHADSGSHILMLEDLGRGSELFAPGAAHAVAHGEALTELMDYLAALHRAFRQPGCGFTLQNRAMRELNAEHIFRYPFAQQTGFDVDAVTPGLAAVAASCRADAALMARIRQLEQRYLVDGDTLVHGDFFPGSFLLTPSGMKIIDPEFCFFGDAEFDVGVLLAHLKLRGQPDAAIEQALSRYTSSVGAGFSVSLCWHYAGIEILRRLLGLAQLPLNLGLDAKRALADSARGWLLRD